MGILPDGVDRARLLAGDGRLQNGMVRTGAHALATLDAQLLIDERTPIDD